MKEAVLITGGTGLLAVNWALFLRERYSVVLGLHNRNILLRGVSTQWIDLGSVDRLTRLLENLRPKIVVHTAAITSVEECEANPGQARHVNVDLAVNIARACAKLDISLIHISSDHLFTGNAQFVDETCPTQPVNIYARTKAQAELGVIEAYGKTMVVRTNFYGWGPGYRRSFSDAIIDTLRSGREVTLFKDVYYTPILMEAAIKAIHDLCGMQAHGIFHVVGDERISKYDFGLKVARVFSLDSGLIKAGSIVDSSPLVQRPHDMSLSNKKTCALLGRKLGSVNEHIEGLLHQEQSGLAQEVKSL